MWTRLAVLLSAAALSFLPAAAASAADADKLEGEAFLDEEACAKGLSAPDCVLSFVLTGKAAKTLYDGMRAKPVREECTGGMEKSDKNGLHCIKSDDGTYNCDFGYHFAQRRFAGSAQDC
jgi:hypothetical protein